MPLPEDKHDILVIPKDGQLYRIECDDNGGFAGQKAQKFTPKHHGQRRTSRIARPRGTSTWQKPWGPAFATVPKKGEPATSQVCCYVVNSENVRASNPWTQAAWSSEPVRPEAQEASADGVGPSLQTPMAELPATLDFLVAGSVGDVYRFQYTQGAPTAEVQALTLNLEGEVYGALRNGLVAGSAPCGAAQDAILPLVNLTALTGDVPSSATDPNSSQTPSAKG